MKYKYGEFTNEQINETVVSMHNDIHKLLLHKDRNITEQIFMSYFTNLLFRFGGLNELLGEPQTMVAFMSTLQAAYDEVLSEHFRYQTFRRAILDCHGYIKEMVENGTLELEV